MLARKSLLIFLTNLVGGVFGFFSLFFIGRYMGPTALGMWGFALSIVGIASLVPKMGIDGAHIKRVSEGRDLGDCMTTYVTLKGALILLFTVGLALSAMWWGRSRGFHDATTLPVLLVVILFGGLAELRMIFTNTFDALIKTAQSQMLFLSEHIVRAPLIVVGALLFGFLNRRWIPFSDIPARVAAWFGFEGPVGDDVGALFIAWSHIIAMVVSIGVAIFLFRRHHYPIGRFRGGLAKDYVSFAAPLAIGSALYLVANRVDAFMIGYFWNADAVGWYTAAQRLTALLLVIPIAIRTLFFPLMSELVARGAHEGVREVALTAQRYISLVILGLTFFLIVWPDQIIHIVLSDAFLPAGPVLAWLSIYTILFALTSVSSTVNLGHGRAGALAVIASVSAVVNVVLNFVFIPSSILGVPLLGMGAVGAAVATVIAEAIRFVLHMVLARRLTGQTLLGPSLWKHTLAAIAVGSLLHYLADRPILGGLDRWYELLGGGVLGGLLYLIALYALRDLKKADLLLVIDLVHPLKLARYVRDEVIGRRP